MDRIGVRELRQHASTYLGRVEKGETLEITDRGRPVALLVPAGGDPWRALLTAGRIAPPNGEGDLLDEPPVDFGIDASGRLAEMRDDER
jgi:prevent-host-death family protein